MSLLHVGKGGDDLALNAQHDVMPVQSSTKQNENINNELDEDIPETHTIHSCATKLAPFS